MYKLKVFYTNAGSAAHIASAATAADVLDEIAALLQRHTDCHHIAVYSQDAHLFSVDCHGHRIDSERA